jgi:hypothetical protein
MNNTVLDDQWVIEEIREIAKSSKNLMKMQAQSTRTFGIQQRHAERKVYSLRTYI